MVVSMRQRRTIYSLREARNVGAEIPIGCLQANSMNTNALRYLD
jgi:hypothetical protein